MNEDKNALIAYRMEQADESLEAARILLDNAKYRPSVSRSYYAMFYGVLALLSSGDYSVSKHSGAISLFDREFVKKQLLDKKFSRWLHEAFDLRQRADYREMFNITTERAEEVLRNADKFVQEVKKLIPLRH